MFQVILFTQWKWSRAALVFPAVLVFALPILTVRGFGDATMDPLTVISTAQSWGPSYPIMAIVLGIIMAVATWSSDRNGKHTYALSLPLPRWHYVLLRFGAGALLLAGPALLLWIGALVATSSASLPPGLRVYPTALALRFTLATLIMYAVSFALAAGSSRVVRTILLTLGFVVLAQILLSLLGSEFDLIGPLGNWLFDWPGPLEILSGRWMLIDV